MPLPLLHSRLPCLTSSRTLLAHASPIKMSEETERTKELMTAADELAHKSKTLRVQVEALTKKSAALRAASKKVKGKRWNGNAPHEAESGPHFRRQ